MNSHVGTVISRQLMHEIMGRSQIPVAQGVIQILADGSVASFAAPAPFFAGEVGQHCAVDLLVENLQMFDVCK